MLRATNFSLFFIAILAITTPAQILPGAKQIAVEHSSVSLYQDVMSIYQNPSLLEYANSTETAFSFSPAPFGITELRTSAAAVTFPVHTERFAISVLHHGFELYYSTILGVSYACEISDMASLGITLAAKNLTIKNYGSAYAFLPSIGMHYKFSDGISTGIAVHNVTASTIGMNKAKLPVLYLAGICIEADDLHVTASLNKESGLKPAVSAGSSYQLTDNVELLIGMSTNPQQFSYGASFSYMQCSFMYTLSSHAVLGYSHQFGLSYQY